MSTTTKTKTASAPCFPRGRYDEILTNQLNLRKRTQVNNLVELAINSPKIDEHGWEFGATFDSKGRGWALNHDVYGIGYDCHSRKLLIIMQVRQYRKTHKNGYGSTLKSYFLVGRNEDSTVFAHCIPSQTIHYAVRNGLDPIYASQCWMFSADYRIVLRQGDMGLIPCKRTPKGTIIEETHCIALNDSHTLEAETLLRSEKGDLYAFNPVLRHGPQTHADIQGTGWHKVMEANRADHHDFAPPTID